VGLTVADLEASIAFYRDVVGMRELFRSESGGEWFDRLTGNRGARLRVAHLALGALQLQLVQYLAGGGERLGLAHRHVGSPHLCVDVDDVEERHARLASEARHAISPLVRIGDTGLRSFYVADPDGVPVEFLG
jgi:catechol 2,3-dioxygenase-like lactoylglutathione lyase family enzyme